MHLLFTLFLGFNLLFATADSDFNLEVELYDSNDFVSVSQQVYYVQDTTNTWGIQEVLNLEQQKLFTKNDELTIQFLDKVHHTYWLKLDCTNYSEITDWVLEIPFSKIPLISWFTLENNNWVEHKDGYEILESERVFKSRFPATLLRFTKGESKTVYIKISKFNLSVPLHIMKLQTYIQLNRQRDMTFSVIVSLTCFMVFMIFFLFYLYRLPSFFLLGLYATSVVLLLISFEGYIPPLPFAQLTMFFSILFTVSYYSIKKHSLQVTRFYYGLAVYFFAFFILSILMRYSTNRTLVPFLLQINYLFLFTPSLLWLSYFAWKKNESQVKFYLLGITTQLVFIAAEILTINLGFRRFTVNLVSVGFFLEMVIFAFALLVRAYKDRQHLIHAQQVAQEQTLTTLQEKAELIQNQNKLLEEKVEQRTLDLNNQKNDLYLANLKLEEYNKEKDYIMSVISHDIRSPFTGVVGFCELLADGILELDKEQIVDFTKRIQENAEEVLTLFENLLEWSNSNLKETEKLSEVVNVYEKVDEILRTYQLNIQKKGVIVENLCDPIVSLLSNSINFSIILRNLISNAIKFTPKGKRIHIKTELNQDYIFVSVSDEGVGIPKEKLQSLFEYSKSKSTVGTNSEKGTGLGLSVCKKYVDKLGATIAVESELGKGTTFTIQFSI